MYNIEQERREDFLKDLSAVMKKHDARFNLSKLNGDLYFDYDLYGLGCSLDNHVTHLGGLSDDSKDID